jgi:hypothetical protein
MVHRHLTSSLVSVVSYLRPVLHGLTTTQKAKHFSLSNQLLHQFCPIEHYGWQFVIALDDSWFCFSTDHEHVELCPKEQSPKTLTYIIQGPKMMLTIAWNPLGFYLLETIPKDRTFNAEDYCDNNLAALLPPAGRSREKSL